MIRVEPGPWHVDNERPGNSWGIVNEETGRTKYIGRVQTKGANHFDRAVAEAKRRNGRCIVCKQAKGATIYAPVCSKCERKGTPMAAVAPQLFTEGPAALVARAAEKEWQQLNAMKK